MIAKLLQLPIIVQSLFRNFEHEFSLSIVDDERGVLDIDIGPRSFTSVLYW